MIWTPRLNFLSVQPFRTNICAAIMAHQVEALAWAASQCGLAVTLPPLLAIYTARAVRDKYPVANAITMGGDPRDTDSGDCDEAKRLLFEVETIAPDGEDLIETLEPYVLMLRSVITQMTEEDLTAGMNQSRESVLITVGSERYGERSYESKNKFVQVGSIIATISYREVERG
jgi:hypothetical protein